MHRHESSEKLGRVSFKISCSPASRAQFNRAVAWLHSFEYEEAEKTFTEVARIDPQCGMAYWGIAMSNYHPLWAAPTPAELKRGSEAIDKAKETAPTLSARKITSTRLTLFIATQISWTIALEYSPTTKR